MQSRIKLYPYQLECLRSVETKLAQGVMRQAVSIPTGGGKTITFAELIRRRQGLGRALVLAHRDELIDQAVNKVRLVVPDANIGKVKAESNQVNAQIIVASVQTLSRDSRLQQLIPDFQTIIVDEAHHAAASTYRKILDYLGVFKQFNQPLLLGVSATLERADGTKLSSIFEEITYQIDLLQLIQDQYLVDLAAQQIQLKGFDLDNVKSSNGDFVESQLSEQMDAVNSPQQVAEAFTKYAHDRKAIVFTPSVKLAHDTAEALRGSGFSAEALDGSTESTHRRGILDRLKTGVTQVVTNCSVLTEGFDETSISAVIIARPTKSKPLYIQMVGRGTRSHPGKKNCLILDCVGATSKHDLMSIPVLMGLDPKSDSSKTVSSVANVLEEKQSLGYRFVNGQIVARPVDLFAFRRQKKNINWLSLNQQCHAISLGNNNLLVVTANHKGSWDILSIVSKRTELLHSNLDLDLAIGVAESIARNEARYLVDTQAYWRNQPASEKQINTLQMYNLPIKGSLSKGEAGDLLTLFFARQQLRNLHKVSA